MTEQQLQKKILDWLKASGHYAIKTISVNRAGCPDILGCANDGRFFAIEVKIGRGKTSALQDHHIAEIRKCGGIAFVAWSLDEAKKWFKHYGLQPKLVLKSPVQQK